MADITIRVAESAADYAAFGDLIAEYVAWARERYAQDSWVMETAFGHQSLEVELTRLPEAYGPPTGKTVLAFDGEEVVGAVAYRDLGDGVCEMKRMFTPARFHGLGIGKALGEALIARAQADGFHLMRLDTATAFGEAIGLYERLGFGRCAPYVQYPERLAPEIVFMERSLRA
jgi:GNAT superfamily N-acetyltransferase